jgi:hypothetical protein
MTVFERLHMPSLGGATGWLDSEPRPHFGEGRYEQSERVIQRLLGVERELVAIRSVRSLVRPLGYRHPSESQSHPGESVASMVNILRPLLHFSGIGA